MTYVLSDIHGNLQRFESIMTQINLQTNDTLYVLGDVIDRYAGGIKILRQIMRMPNAEMLIGNHEYMMLNAIGHCKDAVEEKENTNRREKRLWYRNGGMITHEQLNLFAQYGFGRDKCYTDYAALRKALTVVRTVATPLPARTLTTVRIPYKMGSGLAGGSWSIVEQIIKDELVAYDMPAEIWEKESI